MSSEHRGGERGVDILRANILELSVQNEIISLCTKENSRLLAQEYECEDISILEYRNYVYVSFAHSPGIAS